MHFVGHVTRAEEIAHGVSPNGTTDGTCGTIEFYVDDLGGGEAGFWMYVSSTQEPILALAYTANWTNWSLLTTVSLSNSYGPVNNPWYIELSVYTRSGHVTGLQIGQDGSGVQVPRAMQIP